MLALVPTDEAAAAPADDNASPRFTRGGFDAGLMSSALSIANQMRQLSAEEEVAAAVRGGSPAKTPPPRRAPPQRAHKHGKLYAWGSGDYGRLGHGDTLPQKTAKLVDLLRDKDVRKVVCGLRHTLVLTAESDVYAFGYGGDGQLGHGDLQIQPMPALVKTLAGEGVIDIACGDKHSLALTSGGDLFSWGEGAVGQLGLGDFRTQVLPCRVAELEGKRIVAIAAGAQHSGCVDAEHNVYMWGAGLSGRLGLEDDSDVATPSLVESLVGVGVEALQCYKDHTLALTAGVGADGGPAHDLFDANSQTRLEKRVKELEVKVRKAQLKQEQAEAKLNASRSAFAEMQSNLAQVGRQNEALLHERVELYLKVQNLESSLGVASSDKLNLDKQLGALVNIPSTISEIASHGVRQVACGDDFVLALSDTGDVYAWGAGGSGQLGLGKRRSYISPQLIWGMSRRGVRQVGAGRRHSAALTYNGYVFTWGAGGSGQLGHGNKRSQLQPKLVESLDQDARERSATARLIGCGARHTVAVLSSGDLYMWGKPSFGRLGRAKDDLKTEPVLYEALWRREVGENGSDRMGALGKAEITELLEQNLNAEEIVRYYPDIEADKEAALFLTKAVADELRKKVTQLELDLDQSRKDSETALERFAAEQEKAFNESTEKNIADLQKRLKFLEQEVEMHEKSIQYQSTLASTLRRDLTEVQQQIDLANEKMEESLVQARTHERAALAKALKQALDSLMEAKQDKEMELEAAEHRYHEASTNLKQAQRDLSEANLELKKLEKYGYQRSIEHLTALIAEVSALSKRLQSTSLENVAPDAHKAPSDEAGLRSLIGISNAEIDRIVTQAITFAADEHVDVEVRRQLSQLLVDNAEMRKQLNNYTEGILMQAMERLEQPVGDHVSRSGGVSRPGGADGGPLLPGLVGGGKAAAAKEEGGAAKGMLRLSGPQSLPERVVRRTRTAGGASPQKVVHRM